MFHDISSIVAAIDYSSVIVGAITGVLFACDRNLDIIGACVCGFLTGYGGGIVRDMLLQNHGFYFMQHSDLVMICLGVCLFTFFFHGIFRNLPATIFFADALSVGLFALAGASKGMASDAGILYSIILGALTGVGGGALRDISVGEIPGVFQESNFYAIAGIGGSMAYVGLRLIHLPIGIASVVCVFTVVALRYWSVVFDWRSPKSQDLTPLLKQSFQQLCHTLFARGGTVQRRQRFRGIFFRTSQVEDSVVCEAVDLDSGVREEVLNTDGGFESHAS